MKKEGTQMSVSQRLSQIIDEKGVTYTFLSKKTGIPVNAISGSMLGKRRLTADEFVRICIVLNIDLEDLTPADAIAG